MDRLWAHGRHLLGRFSPGIDPGPDCVLFVLQRLRILVASTLDALVAVLEDHAVFLEKPDPSFIKLVVLVPVFHFVHQFFECCFVNFADVVLQVPYCCEVLAATREVTDGFVLLLVDVFDVRLDISPLLEQLAAYSALKWLLVRVATFVCLEIPGL